MDIEFAIQVDDGDKIKPAFIKLDEDNQEEIIEFEKIKSFLKLGFEVEENFLKYANDKLKIIQK